MSTFGKNVAKARIDKEVSQVDLQRQLGLRKQVLSNIEHGFTDPKLSVAQRIAHGLGVPLCRLVGEGCDETGS